MPNVVRQRRPEDNLTGERRVVEVAWNSEMPDVMKPIVPTIQALAGRKDVVGVVVLWCKRPSLPAAGHGDGGSGPFGLPLDARVVDQFPYDAVLQHADIYVLASGCGGLPHALANSVPAGLLLDKADNRRRVDYSELGIYMGRSTVSPGDLFVAVDKHAGSRGLQSNGDEAQGRVKSISAPESHGGGNIRAR